VLRVVPLPGAEPEPQSVLEIARYHVQVQMRHRLADHVVHEDHRPSRAEPVLNAPLQPLRGHQELAGELGRQIGQQPHVILGHQQRMPAEQRPVIEEREQAAGLQNPDGGRLPPDDGAERAVRHGGGHEPAVYWS
jgi:hypothetical protein